MSKNFYEQMLKVEQDDKMDPLERILLKNADDRTPDDISQIESQVEVSLSYNQCKTKQSDLLSSVAQG